MEIKHKNDKFLEHEIWRGIWWVIFHNPRKIINKFLQYLAMHYLCPFNLRPYLQKWRGVRFEDCKTVYIGDQVSFDERVPENIFLGPSVLIAPGARIISHTHVSHGYTKVRHIHIGDHVFIGVNAVIVGDVTIGDHAAIGAGAVITKDVEPYAIMAGNPPEKVGEIDPKRDQIDYIQGDVAFDPAKQKFYKKNK